MPQQTTENNEAPPLSAVLIAEKLSYTRMEACQLLGFSQVTLWRLEKQGRLRPVPNLGVKIYPRTEIERFLTLPKLKAGAR
jgi:predicted DNA-binding transcriptional regulator AlpA